MDPPESVPASSACGGRRVQRPPRILSGTGTTTKRPISSAPSTSSPVSSRTSLIREGTWSITTPTRTSCAEGRRHATRPSKQTRLTRGPLCLPPPPVASPSRRPLFGADGPGFFDGLDEIDPLVCPRCQGVMRVVSFITARPRYPPHPRPSWRLGSPRHPGSRSASGRRPGSRFPLIPLTAGADASPCEAGPSLPRP